MSSDWLQSANDIKAAVAVCRGVTSLADIVGELGDLDEARHKAQMELEELNKQFAEKEKLFEKMVAEGAARVEAKRKEGDDYLETAQAEADQLLRNASAEAGKMVDSASAEAKQIVNEARAVVQGHQALAFEHRRAVDALRTEHADLTRNIQDAKREHGRLTKLIDELKAKF